MDAAEIFVFISGTLLIALTLWFFFGKSKQEATTVTAEGEPLYECPMHPWITSTDPTANCSLCGMKLVRRSDVDSAKSGAISAKNSAMHQGPDSQPPDGSHSHH